MQNLLHPKFNVLKFRSCLEKYSKLKSKPELYGLTIYLVNTDFIVCEQSGQIFPKCGLGDIYISFYFNSISTCCVCKI